MRFQLPEDEVHFPRSLGIPRGQMPQIVAKAIPEFIRFLADQHVKTRKVSVPVNTLRPTQQHMDMEKVKTLLSSPDGALKRPIVISKDHYILDGHHRWAALYTRSPSTHMEAYQVDLPIRELVAAAHQFDGVEYRGLGEMKLRKLNGLLEAIKGELGERSVGIADLQFPSSCRQRDLVKAAEKDAVVKHGGNHDTVYDGNGQVVTQIPRHDPTPGTCRGIIKALKQQIGAS